MENFKKKHDEGEKKAPTEELPTSLIDVETNVEKRKVIENGNIRVKIIDLGEGRTGIWVGDKTLVEESGNGRIEYIIIEKDGTVSSRAGSSL